MTINVTKFVKNVYQIHLWICFNSLGEHHLQRGVSKDHTMVY